MEHEVLCLMATGLSASEIADRLFLSKRTIDFHQHNLYAKFGVHSATALLAATHHLTPHEGVVVAKRMGRPPKKTDQFENRPI